MTEHDSLGGFISESTKLARDYVETRLEIGRLRMIRIVSQTAGYILWVTISLFLVFLLLIFTGVVASLWISQKTGSYVTDFGITTLSILGIIIILALARKVLFINPIIRGIIKRTEERRREDDHT